jgi:4-amino-4-deoxy-L-arabinose transferase-like glycosyltransferase
MRRLSLTHWTWLAGIIWLAIGIYGVLTNISYIDEAKYLIKGWLMTTGQVGYYSTPEFFYQHMPGGLLWFGLGQKIFGPSLLVGRLQSLILSGLIFLLTFVFAKQLAGKTAGKLSLLVLSLMPVAGLYYVSAVPQGLAVTVLLLAFITLSRQKYLWASFWFTIALIVRENFLFTLFLYLPFLAWQLKNTKELVKNLLVIVGILAVFFFPGWPGIMKIFYNFPGVSSILPVSSAYSSVLGLNWQQQVHSLDLYWRAVREFGVIYFGFLISTFWVLLRILKTRISKKLIPVWWFLLLVTGFNFLAHTWGAFQLTPRAIVSYLAYISPLLAVISAVTLNPVKDRFLKIYPVLLILALVGIRFASISGGFNYPTHLQQINQSIEPVKKLTGNSQNIVWLSEPMSLYLSGRVSYYPLINHTNFFKTSNDTEVVRELGAWNFQMMSQWLDEADLVVVNDNRLVLMNKSELARPTAQFINQKLSENFTQIYPLESVWPGNLRFFQK